MQIIGINVELWPLNERISTKVHFHLFCIFFRTISSFQCQSILGAPVTNGNPEAEGHA